MINKIKSSIFDFINNNQSIYSYNITIYSNIMKLYIYNDEFRTGNGSSPFQMK